MISLEVNGKKRVVDVSPETPLLYVLRNDLGLNGPKFGCGLAQCGSCMVLLDGNAVPSCVTTVEKAAGRKIVTLEGLGSVENPHPLQKAFIEEQAAQCGYCISGISVRAAALLEEDPHPDAAAVAQALDRNLCRCGAHHRIIKAIVKAGQAQP